MTEKFPENEIVFTGRVVAMQNPLYDDAIKLHAATLRRQGNWGKPADRLIVYCWRQTDCGSYCFSVSNRFRRVQC